nr:MAG TPA: hypothetical protein [Caudoviricetes sp.]
MTTHILPKIHIKNKRIYDHISHLSCILIETRERPSEAATTMSQM